MQLMRIFLSFCIAAAVSFVANADVAPQIRLQFRIQPAKTDRVHDFFAEFAHSEGFELTDWTRYMPRKNDLPVFNLKLTRGDTAEIRVISIIGSDQVLVAGYEPKPNHAFDEIMSRLRSHLAQVWPDTRPYHDSSEGTGGD